jgi:hypothetical protein
MQHNVLWRINLSIFALLIAVLIGAGYFFFALPPIKPQPTLVKQQPSAPASGFSLKDKSYHTLTFSPLQVPYSLPSLRIPDLRAALKFHGKNSRPDVREGALFFSLGASKDIISVHPGVPEFIIQQGGAYVLSLKNYPTDLWFEAIAEGPNARIQVFVKDENGKTLNDPKEYNSFTLPEKPASFSQGWQIDNFRVDGTLLARQKAKWSGRDLFLEQNGGVEFMPLQDKQRITFGEGEDQYSVYLDKGDVLAWRDGRWRADILHTENLPLLRVDKVDERLIGMTLFSPKGDAKLLLNLLKTPDPLNLISLPKDFYFQGARTRLHSMYLVNKKREIVGPEDWFLKTPDGWRKIKTAKEVDEYIKGTLKGPLFILHRIENEQGKRWLVGTLYNPSRSEAAEVRLPLFIEEAATPQTPQAPKHQEGGAEGSRSLPHLEAPAALPPQS